jgi:uncharacterized OB-fold protein
MSQEDKAAALPGWFTLDEQQPQLIGSRCADCGTYYFPARRLACRNPACGGERLEEVPLSRTGKVWSFTDACYQPPEPFIAAEPFVPFAIAAVALEKERMTVLGQVASGVGVEQLRLGMDMELVLETLFAQDGTENLIWKWKPV